MAKKRVKKQVGGVMPGAARPLTAGAARPLTAGAALPGARMIKKGGRVKAMHGGMKAKKKK